LAEQAVHLALLVSYDGTAYHGWQIQPGTDTVQGRLRDALLPLAGPAVRVVGASRTDAGVHALGQVVGVSADRPLAAEVAQAALNATLPRDVRVLGACRVAAGFDARRGARLKRYGYVIAPVRVASPFLTRYAWQVPATLDLSAMREALGALRGRHDFSAFRAAAGRRRSPVCTVGAVRVVRAGPLLVVTVSADSFLHHMVRNIVGSLVLVGQGRRPPGWLAQVLEQRERRLAGPTAPAAGLFLLSVRYDAPLFPGGGRPREPLGYPARRLTASPRA
jgi:tRNA pseudouridine38-40 synthase